MNKRNASRNIIIMTLALLLAFTLTAWSREEVTITGTVVGYAIQTDDGAIYELADNEQGEDLSGYSGSRAEVKGMMETDDLGEFITVYSFTILEESMMEQPMEEEPMEEEQSGQ